MTFNRCNKPIPLHLYSNKGSLTFSQSNGEFCQHALCDPLLNCI